MSEAAIGWIVLAGAAFVVLLLGWVGWRWSRGRSLARIDAPEQAMDAAAAALSGFHPLAAAVGTDGAAALVSGVGERLAVLRAGPGRFRAREIDWQAVRATPEGIVIETDARAFARVPLAGIDALDARRLGPAPRQPA